jgi:hypothetical protein
MRQRPELAVLIARIAIGWSDTERRLGMLLVEMLGADARTGMKMYQALSGAASQKAVLRAVARDRLTAHGMDQLEQVLSEYKKVARQRNDVVHGVWEVSDTHPDALVWCDSADYLMSHGEFWAGYRSHSDEHKRIEYLRDYKGEWPTRLLYVESDFLDILDRMTDAARSIQSFTLAIHEPHGDEPSLLIRQRPA